MARGGHSRGGPVVFDESTRRLHSSKVRTRHRTKGAIGEPMIVCDPPSYLTVAQRAVWAFHAPQLVSEQRLPQKARDVLAKYCIAVDLVSRLNRQVRAVVTKGEKHVLLGELRHWSGLARLYESDLLLNPASSVRAPKPEPPSDDEDRELDEILN